MEDLAAHKEEERKKKARREQRRAEQIAQDDAEFAEISAGLGRQGGFGAPIVQ